MASIRQQASWPTTQTLLSLLLWLWLSCSGVVGIRRTGWSSHPAPYASLLPYKDNCPPLVKLFQMGLRTRNKMCCMPYPFVEEWVYSDGIDPKTKPGFSEGCEDPSMSQQYARIFNLDAGYNKTTGKQMSSSFIMYATYYPKSVAVLDQYSHKHEFQWILIWTLNNSTVKAVCLSQPTQADPFAMSCHTGKEFDLFPVDANAGVGLGSGNRPLVTLERMYENGETHVHGLKPLGRHASGGLYPSPNERITKDDMPPCVDVEKFSFIESYTMNHEPYKDFGVLVPFSDPNFARVVVKAMSTYEESVLHRG